MTYKEKLTNGFIFPIETILPKITLVTKDNITAHNIENDVSVFNKFLEDEIVLKRAYLVGEAGMAYKFHKLIENNIPDGHKILSKIDRIRPSVVHTMHKMPLWINTYDNEICTDLMLELENKHPGKNVGLQIFELEVTASDIVVSPKKPEGDERFKNVFSCFLKIDRLDCQVVEIE